MRSRQGRVWGFEIQAGPRLGVEIQAGLRLGVRGPGRDAAGSLRSRQGQGGRLRSRQGRGWFLLRPSKSVCLCPNVLRTPVLWDQDPPPDLILSQSPL